MFNYDLVKNVDDLFEVNYTNGFRYYNSNKLNINYPSVTSIISNAGKEKLDNWRKEVGEEQAKLISDFAKSKGQYDSEQYLKKYGVYLTDHFNKTWKDYLQKNINNIKLIENVLYSKKLKSAGRCDCIAELNGDLTLIDWKSSINPKQKDEIEHYLVQAFVYAYMSFEMFQIKFKQIVVLIGNEFNEIQDFKKPINEMSYYLRKFIEMRRKFDE
jgi:ATP-dependent exoDNAse (exonuclease V) beta subunit